MRQIHSSFHIDSDKNPNEFFAIIDSEEYVTEFLLKHRLYVTNILNFNITIIKRIISGHKSKYYSHKFNRRDSFFEKFHLKHKYEGKNPLLCSRCLSLRYSINGFRNSIWCIFYLRLKFIREIWDSYFARNSLF
ncbi:hypothetical protein H311_01135 [Anncaliia algerae PRA109]|nr:hypothetical protein H311_01135 [Anncaliia algerae PRA109]